MTIKLKLSIRTARIGQGPDALDGGPVQGLLVLLHPATDAPGPDDHRKGQAARPRRGHKSDIDRRHLNRSNPPSRRAIRSTIT